MSGEVKVNVIATGSSGNAIVVEDIALFDCGVPYKAIEPYVKDLKVVFLGHWHSDHYKSSTIRRLRKERPSLRFACCNWMVPRLIEDHVNLKNIDVYNEANQWYNYPRLGIRAKQQPTLHDVPNCCWHLDILGKKVLYATDLATMEGIEAKNYDLYLIEANRSREELDRTIQEKRKNEEFVYEYRVIGTHLFEEQAREFLANNASENSRYIFLHQHRE